MQIRPSFTTPTWGLFLDRQDHLLRTAICDLVIFPTTKEFWDQAETRPALGAIWVNYSIKTQSKD